MLHQLCLRLLLELDDKMRYSVTIASIILVVIFIIGIYLIVNLYNKTDSGNNNGNNNLIIEYKKLRDGFFGISGVVKNKSYLSKLKVEIFRYGFFMGISEDIARHGKKIHDKNMRSSVENGTMPMITLLAPEVVDENKTKEILRDIVLYYTIGEGAEKIGTPIVYWEIGNEVNGNWGTSCDADEYYNRVKVYASAIREACGNCEIVMGSLLDNIPGDRDLEVYLERFLELGGGEYIDIYNFHYYGTAKPVGVGEYYRSGINIYNSMKSILEEYGYGDKPIWVTETCTFSGRLGNVIQMEDEQASDLVKRFVTMKTLGVEKVFWCYIEEPDYESGTDEGFF